MQRQVAIKAEQIARMIVAGKKATRIAIELGMSYDGIHRILRNPDYLLIEERIRNGVLAKMDARLDRRAELVEEVEDAVPEALGVLLEAVKKKRDLKAALELLDRDPKRQFTKGNYGALQQAMQPSLGSLPKDALDQAIQDADITHNILKTTPSPTKQADA